MSAIEFGETVAGESRTGGIHDLLATGIEVTLTYFRHT